MALVTKGYTFAATELVTNTKLHTLVDSATVTGIVNADIGASAAIVDTKLAQITTASKVSGTAITGLASLPSGAGVIPDANLKKYLIGDSTAGRLLKSARLIIEDGTSADTIKCTLVSIFNGDAISVTDNVAKGATTGSFTLNAGGTRLTIEAAGLTGNAVGIMSSEIAFNTSALNFYPYTTIVSNDIVLDAYVFNGSSTVDLTTIASGKEIYVHVCYVTSA